MLKKKSNVLSLGNKKAAASCFCMRRRRRVSATIRLFKNDQSCARKMLSDFFPPLRAIHSRRERSFARKSQHVGIKSRWRNAVCHQLCITARIKNISRKMNKFGVVSWSSKVARKWRSGSASWWQIKDAFEDRGKFSEIENN